MEKIFGKKKIVNLITGLNYYSEKITVPVLGKIPSKNINPGSSYSDWGLIIGLRNTTVTKIPLDCFKPEIYSFIVVDEHTLLKGIHYCIEE